MLAVPAAGDELAGEVAFLFRELDQIDGRRERIPTLVEEIVARLLEDEP